MEEWLVEWLMGHLPHFGKEVDQFVRAAAK
jgi:hypothetical protein